MTNLKLTLLMLVLLYGSAGVLAQPADLTYQGRLVDSSFAASGNYDLVFKLFDDPTDPTATQIGPDQNRDDVPVSNGVFTVVLNFGPNAFEGGGERYLEIHIRRGTSTGAYAILTPRQRFTSSPFSIRSARAGAADGMSIACASCVEDRHLLSIDGAKVTGTVSNAAAATTASSAINVTGVVQIANGGTGSTTKNFVDLSGDQLAIGGNKTFTGVLAGNGAGLANVPGTVKWQALSASQQALPNNGYLTTSSSQVSVLLPLSTSIAVGDIVRVSSHGTGGWRISQNSGQSIIGSNLGFSFTWRAREANRAWTAIASSADGTRLVAGAGHFYTSTDSGSTWTERFISGGGNWVSIASSSDGTKLAAANFDGRIHTSTNSGVSWTPRDSARSWVSIASSSDGTKLVAVVNNGQIYTSTDSGVSWVPRENNRLWQAVASSSDGSRLVAAVNPGNIFVSVDSGLNWNPLPVNPQFWLSIASSSSGQHLAAGAQNGKIWVSSNFGSSWTETNSPAGLWMSIASSADGTRLVAVQQFGRLYTSTDSGTTWNAEENNRVWTSAASSADGTKLGATVFGGQLFVKNTADIPSSNTSIGTAGFLTGGRYSSVELQYIGGGEFMPISSIGTLTGN